ncbi:capsular biosynthesis protein [Bacillus sp. ISL-35]|uniref:YveK family protein n=1 Tax=Bacillus sp. ISL-35 TaxID=2819122 RepID=UPI001BE8495B|nr:Wzz/FepE/Etk N-terminal domain-containing protein [Bacillus sp. ISL-35]MBT2678810.1 capsular biosynthesis protein [Bacillus sp. ISL-35]MBT2703802.1 hypothetical protein [Chryseobacterium sp. ISL-80]
MEETISLKELMQTLRKRVNLILVITLISVLISGIISFFFLTPIYQASTQLLVNQTKSDQSSYNVGEVQTNLQLINTYNVIIKNAAILELVSKELDLDMSAEELKGKITVQSEQNSQVINIIVQDPDAKRAADIANKTAEIFKEENIKIFKIDNVNILAKAKVGEKQSPVKPKPLLNIAIALVVGLMAGVGLAFLLEYLDNTIKTEQDIEKILGMPVLGVIATIEDVRDRGSRQESNTRKRGE